VKKLSKFLLLLIATTLFSSSGFSHSGRTDASGGHRDNKNASGLGSYHYHCGGYPAHLHKNGQCPYKTPPKKVQTTSTPPKSNNPPLQRYTTNPK